MAIQVRRGKKKDFNPDKMLPGEWAGTTDTKEVFFAFAPGDTKKMATYEDMEENIREATGEITAGLTEGVNTAIQQAETAAQNADQAVGNMEQTITQLVQETGTAVEQAETAAQTANTAAQDAQDAAQEAREAAESIGTTAGVMSIKGDAETEYRSGDKINITPADIGTLGKKEIESLVKVETDSLKVDVENLYEGVGERQLKITGAATTITSNDLTVSRALISNASGKVAVSATTSTELGYVHGVTSAIQTQLNGKMPNTMTNTNVIGTDGVTLYGSCPVFKIGNVVHLNAALELTENKAVNAKVFQIPSGYRPGYGIINVGCIAIMPNNTVNIGAFNVETNGGVKIPVALNAGTRLIINITYYSA